MTTMNPPEAKLRRQLSIRTRERLAKLEESRYHDRGAHAFMGEGQSVDVCILADLLNTSESQWRVAPDVLLEAERLAEAYAQEASDPVRRANMEYILNVLLLVQGKPERAIERLTEYSPSGRLPGASLPIDAKPERKVAEPVCEVDDSPDPELWQHGEPLDLTPVFKLIDAHPIQGRLFETDSGKFMALNALLSPGPYMSTLRVDDIAKLRRDADAISTFLWDEALHLAEDYELERGDR